MTSETTSLKAALGASALVACLAVISLFSVTAAVLFASAAAAGGAIARVLLPIRSAFVVRRRAVDVITMVTLSALLLVLALTTPLG